MYSSESYEVLFDQVNVLPTRIEQGEVGRVRTKTIKAGPIIECEIGPVWSTQKQIRQAKEQKERSKAAQEALNEKNARKALDRKINANFGEGDLLVTLTFPVEGQPRDDKEALKEIGKYIRRLKTYRVKRRLSEIKYVYIIERTESERYGVRYHYHMVMSGTGMNRDDVEAIWYGFTAGICNTRRYQWQSGHFTGWSRYMSKFKATQTKGMRRRWNCSKNLSEPKITVSDHRISRRKAESIARGIGEDAAQVFAKQYPGSELLELSVRTSKFVQGIYIYAKLRAPEKKKRGRDGDDAGKGQ